ncbi:glycosyltransferase [Vibrio metschnikovii]|uniref:glycosyltransferase n=1 Tax=Vibrio metschnikovii TaxID=28172 RepID=UPI001C2F3FF0|nr:glycosyltransferase [Vibrio metschnikovii]
MLFIYSALPVGGIETFFVRMAKERFKKKLPTSILLLSKPEQSNNELLSEIKKYADVIFPEDIFYGPFLFSCRLPLLSPFKRKAILDRLKDVDQIHVYDGMHAMLGYRIAKELDRNTPITIGFYHYIKYLWGGEKVAWHERLNRDFIFNYLPEQSLLFFSEGSRDLYRKHKNKKLENSTTFRLGVVDKKNVVLNGTLIPPLKIVAVGRLVEFKTYNFFMVDVVGKLLEQGIDIQFDIYGDGPLKQDVQDKINQAGLQNKIVLKGTLDYSRFDQTIKNYDLFIGSGTAIIQAAALGIPCIVGVENMIKPKTYGYFSEVHNLHYHRKGLDIPLFEVSEIISNYLEMNESERLAIKQSHVDCIDAFTNESCQLSMDALKNIEMPAYEFKFNRWVYEFSRIADRIIMKYNPRHPRRTQFEDFRNINEK